MSQHEHPSFTPRQRSARQKAAPELNREHREIVIGRGYGSLLRAFLGQKDIQSHNLEESFCDIIQLSGDPDLDRVEALISEWMQGGDFQSP